MKLLTIWLILFCFSLPTLLANNPHGGAEENDPFLDSQEEEDLPVPNVIQNPSSPVSSSQSSNGSNGGKANKGDKAQTKSKTDTGPAVKTPLYVFVDGPSKYKTHTYPTYWTFSEQTIEILKKKTPEAPILHFRPAAFQNLGQIFKDKVIQAKTRAGSITGVVFILNASTPVKLQAKYEFILSDRTVSEEAFLKALKEIDKTFRSLSPLDNAQRAEKPVVDTILLTDNAGAINCALYPGPVFGMVPQGEERNLASFDQWTNNQKEKSTELFPSNAKQFFDSWNINRNLTKGRYFYCPIDSKKGYLGEKGTP